KTLKNEESFAAQKVREFSEEVKKAINLKVVLLDERLTTAAVEKSMISAGFSREKRKGIIDQSAAAMILQNYLDSKRRAI
ncbi:MAG: Holliday junction resolvase RuvX, partial [Candidatus Margulisiibacteriota bacterium]